MRFQHLFSSSTVQKFSWEALWSFHTKKPRMERTILAVLAVPNRLRGDKHSLSLGPQVLKLGVLLYAAQWHQSDRQRGMPGIRFIR